MSGKLGIAVDVQRHCGRVEHSLIAGAGVADQRASHRSDSSGGPAEGRAVNHESVDFPKNPSGRQVHAGGAASRGPRKRATVNVADRIVDIKDGNYAHDPFKAHEMLQRNQIENRQAIERKPECQHLCLEILVPDCIQHRIVNGVHGSICADDRGRISFADSA